MSKAKDLAAAIAAVLATVTTANGYATDIGTKVYRGKRRIDVDDVPCCVLVEGNDTVNDERKQEVKLLQRYIVEAQVQCDPDNPNDAAHDVIADLKRALWKDPTLGGLVKQVHYKGRAMGPREDGENVVFAGIHFDCEWVENLSQP